MRAQLKTQHGARTQLQTRYGMHIKLRFYLQRAHPIVDMLYDICVRSNR